MHHFLNQLGVHFDVRLMTIYGVLAMAFLVCGMLKAVFSQTGWPFRRARQRSPVRAEAPPRRRPLLRLAMVAGIGGAVGVILVALILAGQLLYAAAK